jgi:hypothetical protein
MGPTQLPIRCVLDVPFPGAKQPGPEAYRTKVRLLLTVVELRLMNHSHYIDRAIPAPARCRKSVLPVYEIFRGRIQTGLMQRL